MYEYEFRIRVLFPDFKSIKVLLDSFYPVNSYTVKYMKHFRCKENDAWEFKKQLRQIMVFHVKSCNWINFIESQEIPFNAWKPKYYEEFKQSTAFHQNIFDIEYRYEVKLDKRAKLYGYSKKYSEYGLVFELEVCNSKIRHKKLPAVLDKLNRYKNILSLFCNKELPMYNLRKCTRKPVINTKREIKNALKAIKYDGIFGHVYSYENYIYEEWEDGKRYLFQEQSLGNGFVYGAERLEEKVILLYVAQVRGIVTVYNVYDILLKYLPSLSLPSRYSVQRYYKYIPFVKSGLPFDGIIFHTKTDKIFKKKLNYTIDLFYENGFFVTKEGLIECHDNNLINGTVYECNLDCKIIKPRYDRFVSNTPSQIEKILKCTNKKLNYSFLFDKECQK